MRLSKNFLNDYIDIKNIDFKEVADKMVFLGNEYEEYKKMCDAKGIVVGEVLECSKHPESDKLSVCKVDTGEEINQILCGAKNVAKGQKVVVAKIGAILPGNFEIKKAKLAGLDSEGMICSMAELGLEKKFQTEADVEGIHVLPSDAVVGTNAIEALALDDEIIDFELTSNRGDLLSVLGMAYEVGALYNLEVKLPNLEYSESNSSIKDNYTLKVETEDCKLYLAKLVNNVEIKESEAYIKNRLIASGIRPINNVVDISNYVMLETGQPLHFFDADKIKNIIVRNANNEEITTLDGVLRKVENEILITDNNTPIALAGVMGGLDTEVTENTKNILIESAIFAPAKIRNASRKAVRSEASSRFEKGLPKERAYMALKRAAILLNKLANGSIAKDELIYDEMSVSPKTINVNIEKVNKILGMSLNEKEILNVFDRLKLPYENLTVMIPERRLDLNIEEDLIEEIGRIIGYNNLKGVLPKTSIKRGKYSEKALYKKAIRNYLTSLGLNEVITYSLISEEESKMFINEEKELIKLLDPLSLDKSIMRNSLIPSLLTVYKHNTARKIENINIFEVASCYYKEEKVKEDNHLSLLMSGIVLNNKWQNKKIEVDFYVLKGMLENLLDYLGFTNRYDYKVEVLKDMHPGRSAVILLDRKPVGYLGQINPKLGKNVYVLDLNLEILFNQKIKPIKFKEPSKYPSITKDLAFVVEKEIESKTIEAIIKHGGSRLLNKIEVFDIYDMGDKKSIAYSLTFQDEFRTLTEEEVMEVFNRIIEEVTKKINAKLRSE